jgi:hypothetical protein
MRLDPEERHEPISAGSRVPAEAVRRLNADLETLVRLPDIAARWTEPGILPPGGSPGDAERCKAVEAEKWAAVIRSAGIHAH